MRFRILFATIMLAAAGAAADEARFCLVAVKDGQPTTADVGDTWRLAGEAFTLPEAPSLIFDPVNRGGIWTIDAERRFVPFTQRYTRAPGDSGVWKRGPWIGRTIATTPKEELTRRGIDRPATVYDASILDATIVEDSDRRLYLLTADGRTSQYIASLATFDTMSVFNSATAEASIVISGQQVIAIRGQKPPARTRFSAETLYSGNGAIQHVTRSRLWERLLAYDGDGFFDRQLRWRHLGPNGFEDIPGGDIGVPNKFHERYGGNVQDLPTLGRTLIQGADGLFLYDGTAMNPVADSGQDRLGIVSSAYDLPSIGRTVLSTPAGLYDMTHDGKLLDIPSPGGGRLHFVGLEDWPRAKVALVSTGHGLYALDGNLAPIFVTGSDTIQFPPIQFAAGANPGTGEMVLKAFSGLYLLIDKRQPGAHCD